MKEMIIPEEAWVKVSRYCDELRELNAELLAALKRAEAALRKDSRDKSVCSDTVEYHLDGQIMYLAINGMREAIAKAEKLK